jgi:NAD(P)-dependent dehydrogenase (short-subunit alcohol dehydrogenase family)
LAIQSPCGPLDRAVATFGGIDILVNNASAIQLTNTLPKEMKRFDLMHERMRVVMPSLEPFEIVDLPATYRHSAARAPHSADACYGWISRTLSARFL